MSSLVPSFQSDRQSFIYYGPIHSNTVMSIVMKWVGIGPNAFYSHITTTGSQFSMRTIKPSQTNIACRYKGWWRSWVGKSSEGNLLPIVKNQMTSSEIFTGVDCQAWEINSHSRFILQSIMQAADVRFQNSPPQWWPYSHICCCVLSNTAAPPRTAENTLSVLLGHSAHVWTDQSWDYPVY